MPEDTDLIVDVTEKADSAQSLNKSKHFMDLSSNTEELSANEMNTKMKAKKLTNKTKHDISINDISSSELSAKPNLTKDVLCNTTTRNGYSKSITTQLSHDNNDNENKIIMKDAVNGHEADETDTEEEKDFGSTNDKSLITNEPSVNCSDEQIEDNEDNKIKEYLQRSDTAVIFAEPVEKEEHIKNQNNNNKNKTNFNESSGQSVINTVDENHKNGLKTDKKRMPENGSPNQSDTTAMLNVLLARCPHCGKLFRGSRSSLSLQEHITNIHAAIAPISKPSLASSPSSTISSIDTLVARPDNDKAYVCSKCKASFMQKDHLEKHELLHSTQGQSCQLCNKSFANVYRLQRHMLSHDESQVLRKFKCPECFKAFKFKHHLKEHIRIHSGEKPFACPNCGKRFSHSGSYSSHMTSKKCLVVNLKVRKVDQIRSQRTRNNGCNANGLSSQSSMTKIDLLTNNSNSQTNSRLSINKNCDKIKEDVYDISSVNRTVSVFSSETKDNFSPLFLSSELRGCAPENSSFGNYVPSNSYSSGLATLHPALFSAAAASVGLPTHYLTSALSSYPEVANAILRSQMDKSAKDIEISKEKCSIGCNNRLDLGKKSESETILENYDLNSMRKILQIVDATVAAKNHESNVILNGSYGEIRSSNPSPLALSASSLHLPQIAPIDSPDDIKKTFSNSSISSRCRYCSEYFDSKIDLHQHESYLCKSRQSLSINKSSIEITKDSYSNDSCSKNHQQSNALNSSAAESDEESQRDSSSLDDEVMMADGKKVRVRSVLGEETLRILRAQYELNPRPKKHDILRLSQEVNYSPRVVQVWFQNMRARDRRLGKSIPSIHLSGDLNLSNLHNQRVMAFSPSHHSPVQHSIQTPLMPISIPHYKPASNLSLSGNHSFSPSMTAPFPSDMNGLSLYGQRHNNNNTVYFVNSSEFSMTPYSKSDSNKLFSNPSDLSLSDEPLDLSVRNKSYLEDLTNNNNIDTNVKHSSVEVLNLSQKSSRSQMNENSNDEVLPSNISLAILQQQQQQQHQRKELEQTSIVRSMLMNKCRSDELDSSISRFNILSVVNGTAMQSPDRITRTSPTIAEENNEIHRQFRKRSHSDSEDVGHQSDSNNPSDDYTSANSPSRTKLTIASPTKLWKGTVDNVISRDDQSSPPDANIQVDGPGLFTCDQCDKTFSKQSSLARHKYEHSGQRPHKCDVCNKAFKHKHHLTEHKRLHSGEKPFQCKKCLKRFSHSGSYSQHMNHRYSYCKPYRE